MKTLFLRYPTTGRLLLAAILFAVALVLADVVGKFIHFPYAGLVFLLIATWCLYKTEGKTLAEIGLDLRARNFVLLIVGLFLGIASFAISAFARTLFTGEKWHVNSNIDWITLAEGLYIVFPMAATQQLIFRGYPYKKTLECSNLLVANLLWGFLFACYHDIWGNVLFIPFTVGFFLAHYVFSSALLKSGTLLFAIGIHWGNNWSTQYFNGFRETDPAIFYITDQRHFSAWWAFPAFWLTSILGFILLALLLWRWRGLRCQKQAVSESIAIS